MFLVEFSLCFYYPKFMLLMSVCGGRECPNLHAFSRSILKTLPNCGEEGPVAFTRRSHHYTLITSVMSLYYSTRYCMLLMCGLYIMVTHSCYGSPMASHQLLERFLARTSNLHHLTRHLNLYKPKRCYDKLGSMLVCAFFQATGNDCVVLGSMWETRT